MLSVFQSTKVSCLFHLMDVNKDGSLQLNDLLELSDQVCKELGYELGQHQYDELRRKLIRFYNQLVREIFPAQSQKIDASNWEDYEIGILDWIKYIDKEIVQAQDEDALADLVSLMLGFIFGAYNEDHDGYLSRNDYEKIFTMFGINKEHSRAAYSKLDVNGDQKLSRYELMMAIETFFTSNDPSEMGNWIFGNWITKDTPKWTD